MINKRDRDVIRHVEEFKFITLDQATILYYNNNKGNCSRRLKELVTYKRLYSSSSYMDFLAHQRKVFTLEKTKPISTHKIVVMDFYTWIIKNGGEIIKYDIEKPLRFKQIIPDVIAVFRLKDELYHVFLEVDHTHYTSTEKLNRYENPAYINFLKNEIGTDKYIIVIAREDIEIERNQYKSKTNSGIRYLYTDFYFSNLLQLL